MAKAFFALLAKKLYFMMFLPILGHISIKLSNKKKIRSTLSNFEKKNKKIANTLEIKEVPKLLIFK